MVFSSIPFLYYFLPCALILYFVTPRKLKNTTLLITSLVFYGWGEPKYLLLMVASIVVGYIAGLLIEAFSQKKASKVVFIISTVILAGFLAVFKYADFFVENFNKVTGLSVGLLNVALPIGISFYTFQILSYTIDVYRGSVPAQKNFINLASYIAMFPQLIAGPIVRYSDIVNQLKTRTHSFEKFATGFRRFAVGLSKKVFIANVLGELCTTFKASGDKSVLFYWIYAVAFALQVYFDFSGYSDMAIGLGRIMGFDFIENFDYPYISKSATEFWRRWHISLGAWFRDYIYIPLGGNRVSMPRHFFNIFVVWLLTGLWHGAAWTFVVWGLYFAILLVIEKVFLLKYLNKTKIISRIYTLFMVLISFVIFNATDMGEALEYIKGMLGLGGVPVVSTEFTYCLKNYGVILILGIVGATPLVKKLAVKLSETKIISGVLTVVEPVLIVVALTAVTAYLVDGSFNPFLYFKFYEGVIMKNKIKYIITSVIIIAFILGFSLFAWLKPADEVSLSERRVLAQMPELNKNSLLSGSFTKNFEKYATDQFPLRDDFRKIKAFCTFNIFNRSENNGIYNYDGYLLEVEYPVNKESIDYASQRFNYIYNKYLKEQGKNPYLAVIPHKCQFTAQANGYPNAEYDEIVDVLKSKTPDFKYIDIKNTLSLSDYYHTDTHWRQEKIKDVAILLGNAMGVDVTAQYEKKELDNEFKGVYSGQYALPTESEKIYYLTNDTLNNYKVFDYENNKAIDVYDMEKAYGKDPYEMFLSGSLSLVTIENDNAENDKELVIFRDSYGSALAPLMAEGYSKITLVDIRYMHPDMVGKYVDFKNADVLFIYSTSVLNNSETIK